MIGDSGTGKTSLILRFSDNLFNKHYHCTIGVDFKIRNIMIDNEIIKLQIWETAGQERFKSISNAYYRNSHGCIATYDITNRQSFLNLENLILDFLTCSNSLPKLIKNHNDQLQIIDK